jgi:tRNA dimethylallyltransferase
MFEAGLIDETRRLLTAYQSPEPANESDARPVARPLGSLGYRQATQHLRGEISADVALLAAQQAHRNYAKRQLTWFRREPEVSWFPSFGDDPEVQREVAKMIAREVEHTNEQSRSITSESELNPQTPTDTAEKLKMF